MVHSSLSRTVTDTQENMNHDVTWSINQRALPCCVVLLVLLVDPDDLTLSITEHFMSLFVFLSFFISTKGASSTFASLLHILHK